MEFRDLLKKAFRQNVIITRTRTGLRTIDFNKRQTTGQSTIQNFRTRWKNNRGIMGYNSAYNTVSPEELELARLNAYGDYNIMDTDAIVSSALDIIADESTTYSEQGELLVIKTDDANIKKILFNLFYDVLNIEFNLWSWVRTTVKYGDEFLLLDIHEGVGVVDVIPIHPSLMIRDESTSEIKYRYEGIGTTWNRSHEFEEYEIAHFRLIGDSNFLPYGKSVLEGARNEFKRLRLMEDALMINRIMRAPERRLFKIDVGNIPPNEIEQYVNDVADTMKKTPYVDQNGDFNLKYNLLNSLDDYFIPVRGGDSGTSIETLPGLNNDGMRDDVEYFKNKMIAALKIPKDYLGYGGDEAGGSGNKGTLAQIDIRFARTIERIQKIITSELYKIALVHLKVQGFENESLINFELSLTNPSLIFERQKTDVLSAKIDLAKSAREDNPILSDYYIYKNIFGFSDEEIAHEKLMKIESLQFRFRTTQITEQGNDPEVSGRSYGTSHDIASMQVASKFQSGQYNAFESSYTPDNRENNEGRPKTNASSFETVRDKDFGRDPVGRREMTKVEHIKRQLDKIKLNKLKSNSLLNEDNLLEL